MRLLIRKTPWTSSTLSSRNPIQERLLRKSENTNAEIFPLSTLALHFPTALTAHGISITNTMQRRLRESAAPEALKGYLDIRMVCALFSPTSGFRHSLTAAFFYIATFAYWNPGVYVYQKSRIEKVLKHHPELERTSSKTIFPTTACNFRNVCCNKHRDVLNCPFSWCTIAALGRFDYTRGGHIVLDELKLIIEFPHGHTVSIPSASITHYNIPVAEGDVRVSITQYCSGSIFRYVNNGFCIDNVLEKEDPVRYTKAKAHKPDRWRLSLGLFSTMGDIKAKRIPHVPELE